MTDNIFDTPAPAVTTPPVADVLPTTAPADDQLLKTIVNEQGAPKYSSIPDAIKALAASQEHIRRIEADNATLRAELAKAKSMEELVAALKPAEAVANTTPTNTAPLDIASQVDKILNEKQQLAESRANRIAVAEAMKKVYGDKASELFYTKAQELGFSREAINDLSAKNPKAVITLLGGTETQKPTPRTPGIRTDGLDVDSGASVKSGMAFGKTSDLVDAWRAAGDKVKKQLS